jgi:hypothetical protein
MTGGDMAAFKAEGGMKNFIALYEVMATGDLFDPRAIDTKVVRRIKPGGVAAPIATEGLAPINRSDDTMAHHYGQGARKHLQGNMPSPGHHIRTMVANPYKPGTKAAATFELFPAPDGSWRTIDEIRALAAKSPASYDKGYINYAGRDGYVRFETNPRVKLNNLDGRHGSQPCHPPSEQPVAKTV